MALARGLTYNATFRTHARFSFALAQLVRVLVLDYAARVASPERRKCFVLFFLTSVLRLCKTLSCHSVSQVYDERCERRASETSNKHTCSNQMGCFSHGPAPVQGE